MRLIIPKKIDKPWGHEIIYAHSDKYVGKLLHINKGEQLSLQYHKIKDETIYLYSGRAQLTIEHPEGNTEVIELSNSVAYQITPNTIHRMKALENSVILEVSTPELDDVVRLADNYGRKDV